jgi:adenine-specific DNA-methyltransferase
METQEPQSQLIEFIRDKVPYAFQDGKLDPQALLSTLGLDKRVREKLYSFSWLGKDSAEHDAALPTTATAAPDPGRSSDWASTKNVIIEGDNSQVLKVLLRGLRSSAKLIYIDPPYNTGRTFTFTDNYRVREEAYLRETGQLDDSGAPLSTRRELAGSKHAPWLSLMLTPLLLGWHLLHELGAMFVSIDDNEVHHLRLLLDAIFGQENRLATLVWNRGHSQQAGVFKEYHEYVLVYAKEKDGFEPFGAGDDQDSEIVAGAQKIESPSNPVSAFTFPAGTRCEAPDGTELRGRWGDAEWTELVDGEFAVRDGQLAHDATLRAAWTQRRQMQEWFYGERNAVVDSRKQPVKEFFFTATGKLKCVKERRVYTPQTVLDYGTQSQASGALRALFGGVQAFERPKPIGMMKDFATWLCDEDGDLAMDYFAGSGSLAHGVLAANAADGISRRYLMVQAPEVLRTRDPGRALGFETVSDVLVDRMRRVGESMRATAANVDLGYRTFVVRETKLPATQLIDTSRVAEDYLALVSTERRVSIAVADYEATVWEIVLKATDHGPTANVQTAIDGIFEITGGDAPKGQRTVIVLLPIVDDSQLSDLALKGEDTLIIGSDVLSDAQLYNVGRECRLVRIERVPRAVSL